MYSETMARVYFLLNDETFIQLLEFYIKKSIYECSEDLDGAEVTKITYQIMNCIFAGTRDFETYFEYFSNVDYEDFEEDANV